MIITTEKTKEEITSFIAKKLNKHLQITNQILLKQNQYIKEINHKTLTKEELIQLSNYLQKATSILNINELKGNYNEKDFLILILQNYIKYIYNKKGEITYDIKAIESFLIYFKSLPNTGIHPVIAGKIYVNNETDEFIIYSCDNQKLGYLDSNNFFQSENVQEPFYFNEDIYLGSLYSKHSNGQETLLETFFIQNKNNKRKMNAFMLNGIDYNINKKDKNMIGRAKISKSFSEYLAENNLSFLSEIIYTKQTFSTILIACKNYKKLSKEQLEQIENTTSTAAAWWTELILNATYERFSQNGSYKSIEQLFEKQDILQKLFENEIRKGLYINPYSFSMVTTKRPDNHIQNIINKIGIHLTIPENISMQMSTNDIKVRMKSSPIWEGLPTTPNTNKTMIKNNNSNK